EREAAMALPLLATAADLEDYGYAAIPDEVLHEMLLRASARVRRYTRQRITAGTSTVTLPSSPYKLPQRPVRAVNSVATAEGVPLGYTLNAGGVIEVAGCHDGPVVVDYDHGFETLPDELIELVCSIASRLASTPAGMHAGARTEQAGGE